MAKSRKKPVALPQLSEAEQARRLDLVRRAAKRLRRCRGVTSIGLGFAVRGGERRAEVAVVVLVKEKLAPSKLRPGERVPRRVGALRTDVVEDRSGPVAGPGEKFDPLIGGIQIRAFGRGQGTLGCIVFDENSATPFGLTARHVLFDSGEAHSDRKIHQPQDSSGLQLIGIPGRTHWATDSALVNLDGHRGVRTAILNSHDAPSNGTVWPLLGMPVTKSGATTGTTFGTVVYIQSGGALFHVAPDRSRMPYPKAMVAEGDSGSVVVESSSGAVVGLSVLAPKPPDPALWTLIANSIGPVTKALGVFIYHRGSGAWARSPAWIGGSGTVFAIVRPRARATLTVRYPSGRISSAKGLGPKQADAEGHVSWTWVIGTSTTPRGSLAVDATVRVGTETRLATFRLSGSPRYDR